MPRTFPIITFRFRHVGSVGQRNKPVAERDWNLGVDDHRVRPVGYLRKPHMGDPRVFQVRVEHRDGNKYVYCDGTLIPRNRQWWTRFGDLKRYGQDFANPRETDATRARDLQVADAEVDAARRGAPPPNGAPTYSFQAASNAARDFTQQLNAILRPLATTPAPVATAVVARPVIAAPAPTPASATPAPASAAPAPSPAQHFREHGLCAVCWERPVGAMQVGCSHANLCAHCVPILLRTNPVFIGRGAAGIKCHTCMRPSKVLIFDLKGRKCADADTDGDAEMADAE